MEFKKRFVETLDGHWDSGLYAYELSCVDHMVDYKTKYRHLSVLDSVRYIHF